MELQVHHRTDAEVLASCGPLVIRVINGVNTNVEHISRLFSLTEQLLDRYPAVGILVIVEHGTPLPDPEARRLVEDTLPRYGDRVVVGYALLGLGFWAAATRMFTSAIALRNRGNAITDLSLEAVAKRLALELVGLDAQQIVRYGERLRVQVERSARLRMHG